MNRAVILFLALGVSAVSALAADLAPNVTVLEGDVLCIRPGHLTEGFPDQFHALQLTNKVVGTVLDLRFADGEETAVDGAVKMFATRKAPLALLVNSETRGAAAELAGKLRAANAGILIGSTNLPGIIPTDILVKVSLADEKKFQLDAFAMTATNEPVSSSAKNELLPFVDHMSEAELVRKRIKDGEDDGEEAATPRVEPAQPVIQDPSLARAVDLLKALAILKPAHS
ncbi:MAG TPA: hypothetical protein VG347_24095 [Verrucomicrobiae bacterium]|nr:hypothetical protein [Verrucomicrobiae bacterium]